MRVTATGGEESEVMREDRNMELSSRGKERE